MYITEEIKQQIYDLYDECFTKIEQFHRKIDLFIIPEELAKKIKEFTNINVENHWVCLDNYGILHAIEQTSWKSNIGSEKRANCDKKRRFHYDVRSFFISR